MILRTKKLMEFSAKFLGASGTISMTKGGVRVALDIYLKLVPEALVISNFFALGTDRD